MKVMEQKDCEGHRSYHVSDEDGLHLGSAEVTEDVRSKQRSHLEKKRKTSSITN